MSERDLVNRAQREMARLRQNVCTLNLFIEPQFEVVEVRRVVRNIEINLRVLIALANQKKKENT